MSFREYIKEDKELNERFLGFGKKGTIQIFGNDVVIKGNKGNMISLTKNDAKDLVRKLYDVLK